MSGDEPTRLRAPAKLTLDLRVRGVRPDGYHLIEAEMVSLDLADEVLIRPAGSGPEIRYEGPHALGAVPEDDLVLGALDLLGRRGDVEVEVVKRVPAGAGLGGGSSDAAAILRWGGFDDPVAACRLGADVAFCLEGGRARVAGIGEVVEPLPFEERVLTLQLSPLHCSTPEVYRRWDELGGPTGEAGNDLEPAAIDRYPELIAHRDRLADATGRRPRLAGSGGTWFVEGAFPGEDRLVVRTVPAAH